MRKLAIRFSVVAIGATALLVVPTISPAEAKSASRHTHMKKHHRHWHPHYGYGGAWGYPAPPMVGAYSQPGPICPAVGHSFDCKIWPPPYEDDPDRKVSKH